MNKLIPCGHYVLVEDESVEEVSSGGIFLSSPKEKTREQEGQQIGRIVAFGPIAYKDVKGCKVPSDWGVAINDRVEYTGSYEGKKSAFFRNNKAEESGKFLRLVPDTSIVSKLED